jgi:hypothetical protein
LLEQAESEQRWLTAALSGTPIVDEYLFVDAALRPCEPMGYTFDPSRHAPEAIQKSRRWWLEAMRSEYESATVFIDLATQLRQIASPLDVQTVVLRMAQDELRHAAMCARVVETMGGEAKIPAGQLPRVLPHADCGPEESVLREIIHGCCLSEIVNVARLAKGVGEVADPFVRDAHRLLLADERLHAQFGFYYLESRRAWLDEHPKVVRSLERFLRYAVRQPGTANGRRSVRRLPAHGGRARDRASRSDGAVQDLPGGDPQCLGPRPRAFWNPGGRRLARANKGVRRARRGGLAAASRGGAERRAG